MVDTNDIPLGFALYRPEGARYGADSFLLPTALNEEIVAARQAKQETARAEAQTRSETSWLDRQVPASKKSRIGEVDIEDEEWELADAPDDTAEVDQCAVFSRDEPLKMLKRAKEGTPDRDRIVQLEALYLKLKELGRFRSVAPAAEWETALARLDQTHPHFVAVTQVVRQRLILAQQSGRPARIPPLLLLGIAGVGKTHYAKALAGAIGTAHRQLQLDTALSEAALVGNEKRWANTSYGALFEEIVLGQHANPVFVLDEIDKALRDKRSDPLAPLHSLLEPVTSTRVRDISLDFEFDASHVIWIATANYPWRVPQPVRSRMKEFWIQFPTAEESIQIAREVARSAVAEVAPSNFESPGDDIGVLLGHLTAREVYQATSDAVAHAVAGGRMRLDRRDFSADVTAEDGESASGWLH
jgi:ATP-dependent Lon protease